MSLFGEVAAWLTDPAHWRGADGIANRLAEHVELTAVAVILVCLIALPIALWLGHIGKGGGLATGISNLGRAVPTFAVLVMLALGPLGFGVATTIVALVLFGVPPVLTNAYVGIRGVDRDTVEAARGMGMTGVQLLRRVEVPLALPLITAGVRLCVVQVIATATIAALVAGGGLGRIITAGLGRQDLPQVVSGALLVAALALAAEGVFALLQRRLDPVGRVQGRSRARSRAPAGEPAGGRGALPVLITAGTAVAVVAAAVVLAGRFGVAGKDSGRSKGELTIGAAGFTESRVMAAMYAELLRNAGYRISVTTVQNRELQEEALERGQLDVVPEYASTMAEFLNRKQNGPDASPVASADLDTTMAALRRLAEPRGLAILEAARAVDQNAFAVTREFAARHDLRTLSDLGAAGLPVRIAAGEECEERPFCAPGLEQTYGIDVSGIDPLGVDTPQSKRAVQEGRAQMALVLTTDGTLDDFDLVILDDDRRLQAADNLVPVVNAQQAGSADVANALNALAPVLTTADLAAMNRQVDSRRERPEDVARRFLLERGLL